MSTHIPAGLWLATVTGVTGVAGVVVGGLARRRATGAAALVAGWFVVAGALGGLGVFEASPGDYVPLIALAIVVPIVAGAWLLARPGAVGDGLRSFDTPTLIAVQLYRAVGAIFLAAWLLGLMPGVFAIPAGVGDVAVGLAAPWVAWRLWRGDDGSRAAALAWNAVGIADLVLAVTLGFLSSPSPFQALAVGDPNSLITRFPMVMVPAFAVPLSIVMHLAAIRRLRSSVKETASPQADEAPTAPAELAG